VIPRSASLALLWLLLVACGQATSAPAADDPEPTRSATPSTSPTPSPSSPQTSSATRPLDDFPLARGYPETNGDDGSPVRVTDESGSVTSRSAVAPPGPWPSQSRPRT